MSRETPRPRDYAALALTHGALLAGTALLARRRSESPGQGELPALALATFAVARAVSRDRIGAFVRSPVVEGDGEPGAPPVGRGMRRALGELVTCTRCTGTWAALGLVGLRIASPATGRTATHVLAAAGANDLLQSAFALAAAHTNAIEAGAPADDDQGVVMAPSTGSSAPVRNSGPSSISQATRLAASSGRP